MPSGHPEETTPQCYCDGASCESEITRAVSLVAGRWSVPVLEALVFAGGAVRFRELQRRVGAISQKELARQLQQFVHHGIASRHEGPSPGRQVRYALTPRGQALLQRIDALGRWVREAGAAPKVERASCEAPDVERAPCGARASWMSPLPGA